MIRISEGIKMRRIDEKLNKIFRKAGIDPLYVETHNILEMEKLVGAYPFGFCKSTGERSGHIPLQPISEKKYDIITDNFLFNKDNCW